MPYYASKKAPGKPEKNSTQHSQPFDRRKWGQVAAILFLVIAIGFAGWRYWPVSAPDPAKDFAAASRFAASSDFRRLSPQAQKQFMRAYRENTPKDRSQRPQLSDEQRRQLRSNMGTIGMSMLADRAREYLALSPADQASYLKKQAAEMAERMRNRPQGPPGAQRPGGNNPATRPQGERPPEAERGPNRRLQMFKDTTPAERAEVSAYMRAMRKARGNQPPGRGH